MVRWMKWTGQQASTHDVGLYMGDAACPPRAANGELENGDAPNGDCAVWNGDWGMNGDVGEYDGDEGEYPVPGLMPPIPAPMGDWPNEYSWAADGVWPPVW